MYLAVKEVKPLSDYQLELTFENDEKRIFDMKPYLDKGIYKELKDENKFKTVRVSFDSIEWCNQADIDPEFLYEKSRVCFKVPGPTRLLSNVDRIKWIKDPLHVQNTCKGSFYVKKHHYKTTYINHIIHREC